MCCGKPISLFGVSLEEQEVKAHFRLWYFPERCKSDHRWSCYRYRYYNRIRIADWYGNRDILGKASSGNGQIRYGADVINKYHWICKTWRKTPSAESSYWWDDQSLIQQMCRAAKFPRINRSLPYCVAGNTTMNHLFAECKCRSGIRMEPYIPTFYKTKFSVCIRSWSDRESGCSYHYRSNIRKLCGRRYHCRYTGQHAVE